MFDISVLDLEVLVFVLSLIGYPVLIIVGLIVETPVLRRKPATELRHATATVLAIILLVAAAPYWSWHGRWAPLECCCSAVWWCRRASLWCAFGSHRGPRQLPDRGISLE